MLLMMVIMYMVAFPFSLLFEMPFSNMDRQFLMSSSTKPAAPPVKTRRENGSNVRQNIYKRLTEESEDLQISTNQNSNA